MCGTSYAKKYLLKKAYIGSADTFKAENNIIYYGSSSNIIRNCHRQSFLIIVQN